MVFNPKFKETVLYIISKCQLKSNFGKKVLYKLLYFADFNFYKKNHNSITGSTYTRFVHGPVIKNLGYLLEELTSENLISKEEIVLPMGYTQEKFILSDEFNPKVLSNEEILEIDNVISKLGDLSGLDLENLSHKDTPWQVSGENENIDYDLVFYRDDDVARAVE